jgi:hypothetical protein
MAVNKAVYMVWLGNSGTNMLCGLPWTARYTVIPSLMEPKSSLYDDKIVFKHDIRWNASLLKGYYFKI